MRTIVPSLSIHSLQNFKTFLILLSGLFCSYAANAGVRFLSFTAIETNNYIQLNWRTVEEDDIKSYYIERSSDGISWENIGSLSVKADATHNDYELRDKYPVNNIDLCYYRIRAENIDGYNTYSMTRGISVSNNMNIVLSPVPVKNILKIKIRKQSAGYEPGLLCIADATGRILTTLTIYPELNIYSATINIPDYKPGLYMISVRNSIARWDSRFIKE